MGRDYLKWNLSFSLGVSWEGRDYLSSQGHIPLSVRVLPGFGGHACTGPTSLISADTSSFLCFLADDGKLSLEEFQLFFADGVLSEKELEDLFHTIDSDNTK